jgi:hypothetical protein
MNHRDFITLVSGAAMWPLRIDVFQMATFATSIAGLSTAQRKGGNHDQPGTP